MGKTSKWLKNLLTGKKEKEKFETNLNFSNGTENPTTPVSTTPKEKRRWSFRRSSASKEQNVAAESSSVTASVTPLQTSTDNENNQIKHAASDSVISLNSVSNGGTTKSVEEAAAIQIQSFFRSYLARKALCALRGLVKLQALVRGHLVRKQATETLRCMQALVIAQARACAQRARMLSEEKANQKQSPYRTTTEENLFMHMYNEMDRGLEENIKTVEMDVCKSKANSRRRNSSENHEHDELYGHRISAYYSPNGTYSKKQNYKLSPAPSALTELSPRASSKHFEDCSISSAQNSPYSAVSRTEEYSKVPFAFTKPAYEESLSYDYPLFPSYMANTQSSRAKVRSQSAPKQRPDSCEKQPSRRRASIEGRNVPRPVRMQRSSSHVGATAQNYQYPWSIKLDKSSASLNDSECGSTSTVLTNSNYCKSHVSYYPHGQRY